MREVKIDGNVKKSLHFGHCNIFFFHRCRINVGHRTSNGCEMRQKYKSKNGSKKEQNRSPLNSQVHYIR